MEKCKDRWKAYLRERRERLWERQGGRCFWCERQMDKNPPPPYQTSQHCRSATIDHLCDGYAKRIGLIFKGGVWIVMACYECNQKRNWLLQEIYSIHTNQNTDNLTRV